MGVGAGAVVVDKPGALLRDMRRDACDVNLLTGDTIDADEAWRVGLVQDVVAPDQALPHAVALAQKIAGAAPPGVRNSLAVSRIALESGPAKAASALPQIRRSPVATADAEEGVRSFVDKRPARFVGR